MADALSRRDTEGDSVGGLQVISALRFDFIARLRHTQATDPAPVTIHDDIRAGSRVAPWMVADGMVLYDGRMYIPPSGDRGCGP